MMDKYGEARAWKMSLRSHDDFMKREADEGKQQRSTTTIYGESQMISNNLDESKEN